MACTPGHKVSSQNTGTKKIIVALDGSGDFRTIQDAIYSLPDSSATTRIIYIKKGNYNEKVFISSHNILLEGEDRDGVIIERGIARDEWRCSRPDDYGAAIMNINGNDITLKNLTIYNDYGFNMLQPREIDCPNDSVTHKKTIRRDGHQFALRTIKATRLKAENCHFKSWGGDTVSPWNVENGLWYFKDCIMEGGVDFYCPRGWAWAENCEFIAHTGDACIWHDGSAVEDSKTVLKNCTFKGFDGFQLGRYHRDAQFYLVDCQFASNMADKAIYRVQTTNVIKWGERIYYYNCHRHGGSDYSWYADNLPKGIKEKDINVKWVFGNRWKF